MYDSVVVMPLVPTIAPIMHIQNCQDLLCFAGLRAGCWHADLKFHSSSRMKPRWLAFALTLPTDDVLFVQYTVPTIVMSRQCDQHSKVAAGRPYCSSQYSALLNMIAYQRSVCA